jgi:heme-binding NEAT domain protein
MLSSAVLALLLACGGGETAKEAPTPATTPEAKEVEAPPKEEMKEEVKEEAEEAKQVEKISRTFRVPVAEKATIQVKAREQIIEQAKKAGYDRADNVKVEKEDCDTKICTVTVTADATKTVAAPATEADNAGNPCGAGEGEEAEGADNACAPEEGGE